MYVCVLLLLRLSNINNRECVVMLFIILLERLCDVVMWRKLLSMGLCKRLSKRDQRLLRNIINKCHIWFVILISVNYLIWLSFCLFGNNICICPRLIIIILYVALWHSMFLRFGFLFTEIVNKINFRRFHTQFTRLGLISTFSYIAPLLFSNLVCSYRTYLVWICRFAVGSMRQYLVYFCMVEYNRFWLICLLR